jgi:hypothetical protein
MVSMVEGARVMADAGGFWNHKPWWCQPWTIVATGLALVGGSWWWLGLWWLSLPLALAVSLWWWLFLVLVPAAHGAEAAVGGRDGVEAEPAQNSNR